MRIIAIYVDIILRLTHPRCVMHMQPAKSIIETFGGVDAVATLTGRHRTRVFRWMYPKSTGGTGGRIPQSVIPTLLAEARRLGLDLPAERFFEFPGEDGFVQTANLPTDRQAKPDEMPVEPDPLLETDVTE